MAAQNGIALSFAAAKLRAIIERTGTAAEPIMDALREYVTARRQDEARALSEMAVNVGAADSLLAAQIAVSVYLARVRGKAVSAGDHAQTASHR